MSLSIICPSRHQRNLVYSNKLFGSELIAKFCFATVNRGMVTRVQAAEARGPGGVARCERLITNEMSKIIRRSNIKRNSGESMAFIGVIIGSVVLSSA
jgi:hypothetical protein